MKEELKINTDKCDCNKRRLVLDFDIEGENYRFEYDEWGSDIIESFKVDGKDYPTGFGIISSYKHCLQAWLHLNKIEGKVFIDRQYKHNYEFDVYFGGKVYFIECNKSKL